MLPTLPPFDQQLCDDLTRIKQELHRLQNNLSARGHGCACDKSGLCALHAEVNNRLAEAAHQLRIAMKAITKEM